MTMDSSGLRAPRRHTRTEVRQGLGPKRPERVVTRHLPELLIGMRWLFDTAQPDGAMVSAGGQVMRSGRRTLRFRPMDWQGHAVIEIVGPAAAGDPTGLWQASSGKVTIKLDPCGQYLCGTIVGLDKPTNKNGKPKRDKNNPDPTLRKRPLVGLVVIDNMRATGDNSWSGNIYNADDGNTYSSKMKLQGGNMMVVKGCVLFICKDMKFRRVQSL